MSQGFCVLNDGETFTGVNGSHVVIPKLEDDQLPDELQEELENGRIEDVFDGILDKTVEGIILPVRNLVDLWEVIRDYYANLPREIQTKIEAVDTENLLELRKTE